MTIRALILSGLMSLPALSAQAQAADPPPAEQPSEQPSEQDGMDLIGRGIGMIFDRLMTDLAPDLNRLGQDMSGAFAHLAPVLGDLSVLVDDLANYQAPERLENGDILIRRRPGAPPAPPIGDSLRDFTAPGPERQPGVPVDPDAPEIAL